MAKLQLLWRLLVLIGIIGLASIMIPILNQPASQWCNIPSPSHYYTMPPKDLTWTKVSFAETPITNPLKGFVPYADSSPDNFPYSMEFFYFPLNELYTSWQAPINFTIFNSTLTRIANRGHQAVLRVYLDSPNAPVAVPQDLIDAGLIMHYYNDTGVGNSPNYDDPRLVNLMIDCIHALGQKFDGDPRIGYIEIGFLGHWGEWHTSPDFDWMANETTQRAVLQAYEDSFHYTQLQARYPNDITKSFPVGFHDDMFSQATLPDPTRYDGWWFWVAMENAGMIDSWERFPNGGELSPPIQDSVFFCPPSNDSQNIVQCIKTTHATWLINTAVFHPEWPYYGFTMKPDDVVRAENASQLLGYDFAACWTNWTYSVNHDQINVSVIVNNFGVAPFYYPWPVNFGIINAAGNSIANFSTSFTLAGILPNNCTRWNVLINNGSLYLGHDYRVVLWAPNALPNGSNVIFSNENQTADGKVILSHI